MQRPTEDQISEARSVVANPARYANQPDVLRTAWITLKQARGGSVDLSHTGKPAYQIVATPANTPQPPRSAPTGAAIPRPLGVTDLVAVRRWKDAA